MDDGYVYEKWWESIQSGVYLSDRFSYLSRSYFCLNDLAPTMHSLVAWLRTSLVHAKVLAVLAP